MRVILISGCAQNGKDTIAKMMKSYLEDVMGYGVLITHYADLLKFVLKEFFEWDGKKDKAGRHLLQSVGTDVVRKQDENFWVDYVIKITTMLNLWDYVIIPDVRFENEVERWKCTNVEQITHIHVERPDFSNNLTEEQRSHSSEAGISEIKPDFCIRNDGSLEELNAKIIKWIEENIDNGK